MPGLCIPRVRSMTALRMAVVLIYCITAGLLFLVFHSLQGRFGMSATNMALTLVPQKGIGEITCQGEGRAHTKRQSGWLVIGTQAYKGSSAPGFHSYIIHETPDCSPTMFFNFKSITLSVLLTVGLASLATACQPTGASCGAEIHPSTCCSRACEAGSDPTIGVSSILAMGRPLGQQ